MCVKIARRVANSGPRQRRIQWLAPTLLALMPGHLDARSDFRGDRGVRGRRQRLRLVEEQVLLMGAAGFALGRKELVQKRLEPFLQQIALHLHHPQFAAQRVALDHERVELFGAEGDVLHRCL